MSIPAVLLALSLLGSAEVSEYAVLMPGTFHGDEVTTQEGAHWWALTEESGSPQLRRVSVRIRAVHDVILDDEGEATGLEVGVPELDLPPIALLRGPALRDGTVRGSSAGHQVLTREGAVVALDTSRQEQLALRCEPWRPSEDGESDASHCRLLLAREGAEQVLHEVATVRHTDGALMFGDDGHWALLFAGDLDGDGHTDLLLQLNDHYNVSETVLFLSSAAATDEWVREVARFRTIGC